MRSRRRQLLGAGGRPSKPCSRSGRCSRTRTRDGRPCQSSRGRRAGPPSDHHHLLLSSSTRSRDHGGVPVDLARVSSRWRTRMASRSVAWRPCPPLPRRAPLPPPARSILSCPPPAPSALLAADRLAWIKHFSSASAWEYWMEILCVFGQDRTWTSICCSKRRGKVVPWARRTSRGELVAGHRDVPPGRSIGRGGPLNAAPRTPKSNSIAIVTQLLALVTPSSLEMLLV